MYNERLAKYDGDWNRMLDEIKVYRLILSEQDRIGIGTFQPKDEKNQDSTELTGDINYRKIAEYGTDSDPRAFNFDGEFNIANRGLVEFIEVLEARRGVPLRPARRIAGAQDQAEEVRPDRYRRSDPRPHQRAGVSPAAEQRVHGSAARPHGEDRRAVRHPARRTRSRFTRRTSTPTSVHGQAHRPAHDRNGRHVGGADPAGCSPSTPT